MKTLTNQDKEQIKAGFHAMTTLEELCALINLVGNKHFISPKKVKESHLKFLANPHVAKNRYRTFLIPKKSGGFRQIHAPGNQLSPILKCLAVILQCVYQPHQNAYGFVPGKSVADNAYRHIQKNYVFNIDLKDFFPGVEIGRVMNRLNFPPFNLNKENDSEELARYIAWLCCEEMEVERIIDGELQIVRRRVLPQGAATSPVLTNIICERLDYLLTGLAKRFGVTYTRYADDITFSSDHNVYQPKGEFRKELERIIADQHFRINPKKVRLQKSHVKQEVTGITVNTKPNVPKRYVKQIRKWLYYLESYDQNKALSLFLRSYDLDKGYIKRKVQTYVFMMAVIGGKLNYMRMVKGANDSTFLKLWERYEKHIKTDKMLKEILDIWEAEGIEAAIYFKENKIKSSESKINDISSDIKLLL